MLVNLAGLKTDASLLQSLKFAAGTPMTAEERMAQRVSFIWGTLGHDNPLGHATIRSILDRNNGH